MNILAKYLCKADAETIKSAEEVAKVPLNSLDYLEDREIVNKICKQLESLKKNFILLSLQKEEPNELNMTHFMAYNGNIMSIK
jgi:hypothetical protein